MISTVVSIPYLHGCIELHWPGHLSSQIAYPQVPHSPLAAAKMIFRILFREEIALCEDLGDTDAWWVYKGTLCEKRNAQSDFLEICFAKMKLLGTESFEDKYLASKLHGSPSETKKEVVSLL